MTSNDLFLAEFMRTVDMGLFTFSHYQYFVDFLKIEKIQPYRYQFTINTFISPFPFAAFDRFLSTYFGTEQRRPTQSMDLAVINACVLNCWHCYNVGRMLSDLSAASLQNMVRQLQALGTIVVNLTDGEPCLRHDIADICSSVRDDSLGILVTTGYDLSEEIAKRHRVTRDYSFSISLDSANEKGHERTHGVQGSFRSSLKGIETAKRLGFYTNTCAVPTKKLMEEENPRKLVEHNEGLSTDELQIFEPAPAEKIVATKSSFGKEECERIFQYMADYNQRTNGIAIYSIVHSGSFNPPASLLSPGIKCTRSFAHCRHLIAIPY